MDSEYHEVGGSIFEEIYSKSQKYTTCTETEIVKGVEVGKKVERVRPVPVWSGFQFWIGSGEVSSCGICGGNGGFVSEIIDKRRWRIKKEHENN